ncbi:MAG: hypothetical protein EOM52_01905 [Clostridia bacterium]|nr:hypothetical protein [Clostridia bacterium]
MGELFTLGREMTHPYTSGKLFGELGDQELRRMTAELTAEEACAASARHYYEPMAELAPEHKAALGAPALSPEACHMPQEVGARLLKSTPDMAENGFGVLENGVGYAAIRIEQTGITDEMIRTYREEFAHDGPRTLFYKLWFPGMHLIHYENGVVENFGWGMLNLEMDMEQFSLAHLGITRADILREDPNCLCVLGLCGRGWEIARPEAEPVYTCMVQHTRETAAGRELRVRFWSGVTFAPDGALNFHIDPDRARTEAHMRLMMEHCMREYQNELRLMRAFWAEKQRRG